MKSINFTKHILPHLIAVLTFLIVTVIFFNPIFFDNKALEQHDINQWKGGAQELIEFREQTGEEGLWTNSMFGGMPAYLIDVDWSDSIVGKFKQVLSIFLPHPIKNIFLAFVSFYILLLSFKVRPYLAIVGALGFGLSTYMIIGLGAGHNSRIGAVALMPMVLAGIHLAFRNRLFLGCGVTALGLALHLRENHLQITYYLLLIVLIYGAIELIQAIKEKTLADFAKRLAVLILAATIALGTFIGKLWTTHEYSKYSIRGKSELTQVQSSGEKSGLSKDYAFQYSNDPWGPMTLLVPNFLGGGYGQFFVQEEDSETLKALQRAGDQQMANQLARYSSSYWGEKPPAPYYVGAIFCFLFVLGLFFAEKKYVIWLSIVSLFGIILSLGDSFASFNYFMFDYFPGYNKFRSVTFTMIMPFIAFPLLGFVGLENLLKSDQNKEVKKKLYMALGISGGLCLLIAILAGIASFTKGGEEQLPVWFTSALKADREALMRADALRSMLFILLGGVAIYLAYLKKINFGVLAITLGVLVLLDTTLIDKRHFGEENYRRSSDRSFIAPTEADKQILKDKSQYRVYNLQSDAMSEARTSYHHHSIGGYHGAKMRRYQDFYTNCIEGQRSKLISGVQNGNMDFSNYGAINMLNAKYLTFGPDKGDFIINENALGNAWLVDVVKPVNSPDEELEATCMASTDSVAVVDVSKFDVNKSTYSNAGVIKLYSYAPNKLEYTAELADDGFAVFSEIYYPHGWTATIDGKETEIKRANFILRALEIPAGKHEIVFEFKPKAYAVGDTLILISCILLLLLVLGSIGYSAKKSLSQVGEADE
ncbi:MAG: YfhO family protein [Fulvivirga sp.]|uniref:YfhO family protein n=1 Tax=Fulvivirga sp. TaxID=1931237 RepID=UPI0032EE197C